MPRGPAPKPLELRQRTNVAPSRAELVANPKRRPPKLPIRYSHGGMACALYHPQTLEWWREIWKSPMSSQWIPSDLHQLAMLAVLVNEFYHGGSAQIAAEIRQRSTAFGLTPLDRLRLEWTIKSPESKPAKPSQPTQLHTPADDPRAIFRAVK